MDYEDQHNTKLGADVCEHVLEVTEKILQEASSNRPVLTRSLSQPVSDALTRCVCVCACACASFILHITLATL